VPKALSSTRSVVSAGVASTCTGAGTVSMQNDFVMLVSPSGSGNVFQLVVWKSYNRNVPANVWEILCIPTNAAYVLPMW
jgi:hypothetical protein